MFVVARLHSMTYHHRRKHVVMAAVVLDHRTPPRCVALGHHEPTQCRLVRVQLHLLAALSVKRRVAHARTGRANAREVAVSIRAARAVDQGIHPRNTVWVVFAATEAVILKPAQLLRRHKRKEATLLCRLARPTALLRRADIIHASNIMTVDTGTRLHTAVAKYVQGSKGWHQRPRSAHAHFSIHEVRHLNLPNQTILCKYKNMQTPLHDPR
jgi:hypothetical protein